MVGTAHPTRLSKLIGGKETLGLVLQAFGGPLFLPGTAMLAQSERGRAILGVEAAVGAAIVTGYYAPTAALGEPYQIASVSMNFVKTAETFQIPAWFSYSAVVIGSTAFITDASGAFGSGNGNNSTGSGSTFSRDGLSYNSQGFLIGEEELDSEPLIDPLMFVGGGFISGGLRDVGKLGLKAGITGFTKHGINQAIERGVKPYSILDALRNPLKVNKIVFDNLGRPSQRFIGREAEVVINPATKKVISINPTSSKKVKKLLKE